MKKVWKVFDSFGKYALVLSVLVIMFSCVAQVIARFVFNYSLAWTSELSRYLLCYITYMGAFVLIKERQFIKMDILESKITPKVRPYYNIIMEVLMITYAYVILVYGYELVGTGANQRSSVMHIPKNILYMVMPVPGVIMIINSIRNIVEDVRKLFKKEVK